jgi:hypothetical protein
VPKGWGQIIPESGRDTRKPGDKLYIIELKESATFEDGII